MKLSPFANLFLLFITHTPDSSAKNALHKRMELGRDLLEEGASSPPSTQTTQLVTSTPPHASLTPQEHPSINLDDKRFQEGSQDNPHAPPDGTPTLPKVCGAPLTTRTNNGFSLIGQIFSELFTKCLTTTEKYAPQSLWPSGGPSDHAHEQRFFSHQADLQQTFQKLPNENGIISTAVQSALGQDHQSKDDITLTLYETADFFRTLQRENTYITDLSQAIRGTLHSIGNLKNKHDVIEWVAKNVYVHVREPLINSPLPNFISEHLDHSLSYLARLYYVQGPEKLFETALSTLLRDSISSWHAAPEEFFEDLFKVGDALKFIMRYVGDPHAPQVKRTPVTQPDVAEVNRATVPEPGVAGAHPHLLNVAEVNSTPVPELQEAHEALKEFDRKYTEMLGDREAVPQLISNILDSDIYKSLEREFLTPIDVAGYEIALAEPMGKGQDRYDMDHDLSLIGRLGLPSTQEALYIFQAACASAALNTRRRITTATTAFLLKKKIDKHSRDDMIAVLAHLENMNKRKREEELNIDLNRKWTADDEPPHTT